MSSIEHKENQNKPKVLTTQKGANFELHFDSKQLYHFKGMGVLPVALEGGFTSPTEAYGAFLRYDATQSPPSYVNGAEELSELTTVADLRKWAQENNIEIPESKKAPTAIKKFLEQQVA